MEETGDTKVVDPPPRVSRGRVCFHYATTILAYISSVIVLGSALWFMFMRDYTCEDLLHMPRIRILMGVCLLVVFAASNAIVLYGTRCLLQSYLFIMFCLIVVFTMGLAFLGAYKMESRSIPGSPMWLRNKVNNDEYWSDIKTCIFGSKICSDLGYKTMALTSDDFSMNKLSRIENGCCTPPSACGMEYINATFWSKNQDNADDGRNDQENADTPPYRMGDCESWSNKNNQLCYNCQSCKDGFLATLHHRWRIQGALLIFIVVLLTSIHTIRFVVLMYESSHASQELELI